MHFHHGKLALIVTVTASIVVRLSAVNVCLEQGKLKPNAEYCEDDAAPRDCINQFGILTAGAGSARRARQIGELPDQACEAANPTLAADRCRQTCATCCVLPEHNCNNNDNDGTFKCTDNAPSCKIQILRQIMVEKCPGTCGYCLERRSTSGGSTINNNNNAASGDCKDTISNCDQYKSICNTNQTLLRDSLIRQCPVTCGLCEERKKLISGSGAADDDPNSGDLASNCAENTHLCNKNLYRDLMRELCRDTCKSSVRYTGPLRSPSATCFDNNPECEKWSRNGYCDSGFYTPEDRRAECALTCGLC